MFKIWEMCSTRTIWAQRRKVDVENKKVMKAKFHKI